MKNLIERIEKIPIYGKEGSVRNYVDVNVTLAPDEVTGEYCYTPEALMAIDRAISADADIPLPEEIRALRERLGKSQREMCRLLRLGDRTWTRWESGAAIPDPANRQQIRLLANGGLSVYELERSLTGNDVTCWLKNLEVEAVCLTYGTSMSFDEKTYFCYEPVKKVNSNETKAVVLAA